MRGLLIVCWLVGAHAAGTAFASPAPTGSHEETRAIDERVAAWLGTCLADWDKATHMTTNEWRAACQRVSVERGKFRREGPLPLPIGTEDGQR